MSAVMDRASYAGVAYARLQNDFIAALNNHPATPIDTPAWPSLQAPVAEIINESFAATDGTGALHELLQIVVLAAAGGDLRAKKWIDGRARDFAEFHSGDLAVEMEAGDDRF